MAPQPSFSTATLWLAACASLCAAALDQPPTLIPTRHQTESIFVEPPVVHAFEEPVVLRPLRSVRRGNTKRDRRAALELKAEETFSWIAPDGTSAELKIETPAQDENIVNLELIDDMVQKVQCPTGSTGTLKIQFAEAADFDDAEDVWQWVNKDPANHFIMVVGAGGCGGNAERVVYNVAGLGYDDDAETAALDVQETTWKQAAHTFDLTLGKVDGAVARREVHKRGRRGFLDGLKDAASGAVNTVVDFVEDIPDKAADVIDEVTEIPGKIVEAAPEVIDQVKNLPDQIKDGVAGISSQVADLVGDGAAAVGDAVGGVVGGVVDGAGDLVDGAGDLVNDVLNPSLKPDFVIPFDNEFPNKTLSFSADGISVSAVCKECFTTGSFDVKGRFRAEQLELKEAWIELSTEGVTAKAVIGLGLKGALTGKIAERSLPIFKFSPAGVSIPGVLTIGPTISVNMGVELSEITAGVNIQVGGTSKIPASSSRLNFLDKDKTKTKGWKPTFETEPFTADGFVEAKASAFIRPAIGLEISAVETGLTAEISANTPALTASLKAITCKLHLFGLFRGGR